MKRLLSLAGFVIILSLIPLASVWAVWEGNAGIGQSSDFPGSGLYAKSDMFPKNTIVEIKNLETEKSVRAVIIGSSGIPGLVAVLSPETASSLSIKAGSVCRVRIFIPSITERPADGTIVAGASPTNADPDANPAAAVNQPKDSEVPLEKITEAPKDPLVALAPSDAEASPASSAQAESRSAAAESAPPAEPSSAPAETAAAVTEPAAQAAPAPAVVAVASPAEEPAADAAPAAEAEPAAEETVAAAEPVEKTASAVPETNASTPVAEPELAVVGEDSPSASESEVALVPAEPLPPSAPAPVKRDVPVVAESAPVPPASAVASTAGVPEVAPVEQPSKTVSPASPAQAASPASVAISPAEAAHVAAAAQNPADVPVVSSLAKGGYYIQIGSYTDMSNVKKIIDKYGLKYPFAVEKGASKNADALKVYVGPVKKDEYGAVLERFRQLGFKDAFVKKVQ